MDHKIASVCFVIVAMTRLASGANIAWDEAVDGDLSDDGTAPTVMTLVEGTNIVRGQIGGPDRGLAETGATPGDAGEAFDDGYDAFSINVPPGYRLVDAVLTSYRPTPGNLSTGYNLWEGPAGLSGTLIGMTSLAEASVGFDLNQESVTGALGPGAYTIDLREFTNEDNVYEINFLLLPRPSTVRAAVMGNPVGSSWIADVGSTIQATGLLTTVDTFDLEDGIPSTATMERYCAVLAFTDYADQGEDFVLFGDRLADYVDQTGGVVVGMFSLGGISIAGRFDTDGYWAIDPGTSASGSAVLGTVHEPSHPIMAGVTSFDGGSSSYRPASDTLHVGATRIADWSGGTVPLAAARTLGLTEASIRRADLSFYPPSDAVRSDFWDDATDGDLLMANALRWVAETCRGPRFADGFENGSASRWSSSVGLF